MPARRADASNAAVRNNAGRKRRATAEDIAIGQKLRALRLDRGLSQGALAGEIGVTFQQLQKYEKGANRVSAGRLMRIAAALHVPVTAFYGAAQSRASDRGLPYLNSAGAVRLVRAYAQIAQRGPKYALLALARALADKQG